MQVQSELRVTINFVLSFLYDKLPRRRVNLFGEELEKNLKFKINLLIDKVDNNNNNSNNSNNSSGSSGNSGSGGSSNGASSSSSSSSSSNDPCNGNKLLLYCLSIERGECLDQSVIDAAKESAMDLREILDNLPTNLHIAIYKGAVLYKIGSDPTESFKTLYQDTIEHLFNNKFQQFNLQSNYDSTKSSDRSQQQQQQHQENFLNLQQLNALNDCSFDDANQLNDDLLNTSLNDQIRLRLLLEKQLKSQNNQDSTMFGTIQKTRTSNLLNEQQLLSPQQQQQQLFMKSNYSSAMNSSQLSNVNFLKNIEIMKSMTSSSNSSQSKSSFLDVDQRLKKLNMPDNKDSLTSFMLNSTTNKSSTLASSSILSPSLSSSASSVSSFSSCTLPTSTTSTNQTLYPPAAKTPKQSSLFTTAEFAQTKFGSTKSKVYTPSNSHHNTYQFNSANNTNLNGSTNLFTNGQHHHHHHHHQHNQSHHHHSHSQPNHQSIFGNSSSNSSGFTNTYMNKTKSQSKLYTSDLAALMKQQKSNDLVGDSGFNGFSDLSDKSQDDLTTAYLLNSLNDDSSPINKINFDNLMSLSTTQTSSSNSLLKNLKLLNDMRSFTPTSSSQSTSSSTIKRDSDGYDTDYNNNSNDFTNQHLIKAKQQQQQQQHSTNYMLSNLNGLNLGKSTSKLLSSDNQNASYLTQKDLDMDQSQNYEAVYQSLVSLNQSQKASTSTNGSNSQQNAGSTVNSSNDSNSSNSSSSNASSNGSDSQFFFPY